MIKKLFILSLSFFLISPVFSAAVPSPVSQWKMNVNTNTTNVIDSVGSNTGTAQQNTDQLDTTGKINGALTFNGSSDYINCGSDNSLRPTAAISIALWAYIDLTAIGANIVYMVNAGYFTGGVSMHLDNRGEPHGVASVRFIVQGTENNTGWIGADNNVSTTGWYHIVGTYDKDLGGIEEAKLYINNVKVATADFSETIGTPTSPLYIGSNWTPGSFWKGKLDDVRFYNIGLSADEVSLLYNGGDGTEDENPAEAARRIIMVQ